MIHIIGGGLAGSEAAWQAAARGVPVTVHEMRPVRPTAVHKTDWLAELVCSNSFRGDKLDNAVGLLKEEMRRLGSLVMRAADAARVPAGAALAVDRERFSALVTEAITSFPRITVVREEVPRIPDDRHGGPVIVATGPLTSDALSADIASMVGAAHLYFYDAVSPIVLADTIDRTKVFRASRWDRSLRAAGESCGVDDGEGDYLNCPFTAAEYARFYDALVAAERCDDGRIGSDHPLVGGTAQHEPAVPGEGGFHQRGLAHTAFPGDQKDHAVAPRSGRDRVAERGVLPLPTD